MNLIRKTKIYEKKFLIELKDLCEEVKELLIQGFDLDSSEIEKHITNNGFNIEYVKNKILVDLNQKEDSFLEKIKKMKI